MQPAPSPRMLITKAFSALLLPPGILVLLLAAALVLSWRRPRLGRGLVMLTLAALYALSTSFVSSRLLQFIEPEPRDPAADRSGQAIVVLGGGSHLDAPEYGGDTVNSLTLARLRYGAQLYRALKKPVLVSGGTPPGGSVAEAQSMRQVLQREFQVPVTWVEERSRNTLENARASVPVLRDTGVTRIYLVTHASHMNRARFAFETAGLAVIPAATGYAPRRPVVPMDFVPTAHGLYNSSAFFHEVIGLVWYRLLVAIGR